MVEQAQVANFVVAMDAIVRYAYNVNHEDFARDVYGKQCEAYTLEKFKMMQNNLTHFIGQLDEAHRVAFAKAAIKKAGL